MALSPHIVADWFDELDRNPTMRADEIPALNASASPEAYGNGAWALCKEISCFLTDQALYANNSTLEDFLIRRIEPQNNWTALSDHQASEYVTKQFSDRPLPQGYESWLHFLSQPWIIANCYLILINSGVALDRFAKVATRAQLVWATTANDLQTHEREDPLLSAMITHMNNLTLATTESALQAVIKEFADALGAMHKVSTSTCLWSRETFQTINQYWLRSDTQTPLMSLMPAKMQRRHRHMVEMACIKFMAQAPGLEHLGAFTAQVEYPTWLRNLRALDDDRSRQEALDAARLVEHLLCSAGPDYLCMNPATLFVPNDGLVDHFGRGANALLNIEQLFQTLRTFHMMLQGELHKVSAPALANLVAEGSFLSGDEWERSSQRADAMTKRSEHQRRLPAATRALAFHELADVLSNIDLPRIPSDQEQVLFVCVRTQLDVLEQLVEDSEAVACWVRSPRSKQYFRPGAALRLQLPNFSAEVVALFAADHPRRLTEDVSVGDMGFELSSDYIEFQDSARTLSKIPTFPVKELQQLQTAVCAHVNIIWEPMYMVAGAVDEHHQPSPDLDHSSLLGKVACCADCGRTRLAAVAAWQLPERSDLPKQLQERLVHAHNALQQDPKLIVHDFRQLCGLYPQLVLQDIVIKPALGPAQLPNLHADTDAFDHIDEFSL